MSGRNEILFMGFDIREFMESREREMCGEIDALGGNQLLNSSPDDLCNYLEKKYKIDVPRLKEGEITVEQSEARIDVSRDPGRVIHDRSKPFYLKGTAVTFYVPFDGNHELFYGRPSTFTTNPPGAGIRENEIILTYSRLDHDANAVKSEFEHDLYEIRRWLEWMEKDISTYNNSIRGKAHAIIEARRQKLIKDQGLVASLGFPLRRRDNMPQTYITPTVQRKVQIPKPSASTSPFVPEPTLEMQEYEHILSVISNMVTVMERSPKAFSGMCEEDIRQHFLVQLNGQYEGQATGETFNFDGKTDILIRVEGKNIFVAECKFWDGPASLKKALDQLLGYATWRDTKIALIIFNRGKNFSSVLTKIPEVIKSHPNFKREISYKSETGFRFVLRHRDDTNREMILTVMAFDTPI